MKKKTAPMVAAGMLAALVLALPPRAAAQGDNNMYVTNLKGVQEKVVSLAEAIPADKYGWRPSAGVRSVSEVFMHVASANYFYGRNFGVEAPAGLRDWEKTVTTKADVITKLKASFDALAAGMAKADLSQADKANAALTIITHGHEHLGQMIAYARSNGVVPPWSK